MRLIPLCREEIWSLQVDDSVSSISCDGSGNIVATLASGSIAVAQVKLPYRVTTYISWYPGVSHLLPNLRNLLFCSLLVF